MLSGVIFKIFVTHLSPYHILIGHKTVGEFNIQICNSEFTSFNQNWEENSAGTANGWLELPDTVLQEQLF